VKTLLDWYNENKRDLPWRKTDPWGVLVSEFMLQQTPVSRVIPKWNEWMERWPTPHALASAKKSDVLKAWDRLGYPRRALRLHESAKIICEKFGGEVPRSREDLLTLPGVGSYTAGAIAAFAFGEPALVLDINIRRFYARHYDGQPAPRSHLSQVEERLRRELIPKTHGALWAQATMEFGALICTARSPQCAICVLAESCEWRKSGYPTGDERPRKQAKFEGSDRQCRGVVLSHLRQKRSVTYQVLTREWQDSSQLERAIKTLIADGLIETTGDKKSYRLVRG
jgi:A/G-specific adenine glycosylase